ncbi:helix-turn-helix transcriptional regulator [Micrococcales bacterium 31B]|nr:helix-turn-helix transcriptional regulator [Micrococcales bacterium 31B]
MIFLVTWFIVVNMTISIYSDRVPELTLSDRILIAMRHANVRSGEVAEYCGVHVTSVSNWLRGREPNRGTLRLIAQRCDVNLDWLSTGVKTAPSPDGEGASVSRLPESNRRPNHYE